MTRGEAVVRQSRHGFLLLSGDDPTAADLIRIGACGVISVTANVAPHLMSELCKAALAGDLPRARQLNNQLLPLHFKLFVEPNPIAVKWALAKMGRIPGGIRLPLVPLSEAAQAVVQAALKDAGVH